MYRGLRCVCKSSSSHLILNMVGKVSKPFVVNTMLPVPNDTFEISSRFWTCQFTLFTLLYLFETSWFWCPRFSIAHPLRKLKKVFNIFFFTTILTNQKSQHRVPNPARDLSNWWKTTLCVPVCILNCLNTTLFGELY